MKKKLQVFVSSTYEDLKEERQAAVQAILTSGHIPAGMELFSAGDESQKETIKKWIEESDVYLLILGGRYGSIDHSTGKSYTHWEYEYANQIGKPRFSVVISDSSLENKVRNAGTNMMEKANETLYREFRKEVLSKLCKIYEDSRDIQLAIFQKMSEYSSNAELIGWVYGKDVPNSSELINENTKLSVENNKLQREITALKEAAKKYKINKAQDFNGISFQDLKDTLKKIKSEVPINKEVFGTGAGMTVSIYNMFVLNKEVFSTGITNVYNLELQLHFLYFNVSPKLMVYGLLEKVKAIGGREKIQVSKLGYDFLRQDELLSLQEDEFKAISESTVEPKRIRQPNKKKTTS